VKNNDGVQSFVRSGSLHALQAHCSVKRDSLLSNETCLNHSSSGRIFCSANRYIVFSRRIWGDCT